MNFNDLTKRAHENAVKHGFWDERMHNEHYLMLVITEVGELVEADRKGKRLGNNEVVFDALKRSTFPNGQVRPKWYETTFETHVKNTVEDEFADVAIRLFDLAGALGVDFDKMKPCQYYRAYDKFSFTENAFGLVKGLSRDVIGVEKRIQFGLEYVKNWAQTLNINLEWHIEHKMKYNESRPPLHGKRY